MLISKERILYEGVKSEDKYQFTYDDTHVICITGKKGRGGGKPSFYTYISTYLLSRVFTIIKSSIDPPLSGRIIRLMKMELMKTLNI